MRFPVQEARHGVILPMKLTGGILVRLEPYLDNDQIWIKSFYA
jgi:hypothetical protein